MNNDLDQRTVDYLRRCGHSDRAIASYSKETRLFHDLDLLGDTAFENLQVLSKDFGVDFTGFDFYQHFPTELALDALLVGFYRQFRLNRCVDSLMSKYKPITIGMIQDAIAKGKMVTPSEHAG
jgi:Protein of unknown function (DUF1493)